MSVVIDENAGFCFGVVKAIAAAEEQLRERGQLYCLGDIVHNNAEVQRLAQLGLKVIDHQQMDRLPGATVLIRAHGEPPATYELAHSQDIKLIDATCPIVLALQKRIREGYEQMRRVDGQVVIFGKQGHAEVIGLCGQTDNRAVVVSTPDDLDHVDFGRPIRLYSQTTKSKEEYRQLIDNMKARVEARNGETAEGFFVAYDTICNRVANRAVMLEEFARGVDVVLFVSGKGSSNGHYLYEYCKEVQPNTRMVSAVEELRSEWFEGVEQVGVTGATSTPRWLMEAVAQEAERLSLKDERDETKRN